MVSDGFGGWYWNVDGADHLGVADGPGCSRLECSVVEGDCEIRELYLVVGGVVDRVFDIESCTLVPSHYRGWKSEDRTGRLRYYRAWQGYGEKEGG